MFSELKHELNTYKIYFSTNQGTDAREYRSSQKARWEYIFKAIKEEVNRPTQSSNLANEIVTLFDRLEAYLDGLFGVERLSDETFVVTGQIPLIANMSKIAEFSRQHTNAFIAAVMTELAIGLRNNSAIFNILGGFTIISSFPFNVYSAQYLAEKVFGSNDTVTAIKKNNEQSQIVLQSLSEHLDVYRGMSEKLGNEYNEKIGKIGIDFESTLRKMKEEASSQIEARLNAQQELDKIQKPVELWSEAAKRHRRWFTIGLLTLILAVTIVAIVAFYFLPSIFTRFGLIGSNLPQSFTPTTTLLLAMFVALIAAVGFIFKIIGRFVTNALTLAEDAEVRAALADTFIGLTAEDTKMPSEIRDQARTVMLAALFRPLPGHQQEEITAPTVLSLAQDLLGKKSS